MNKRIAFTLLVPLFAACESGSKKVSADAAKPVLQAYAANLYQMYTDALADENTFATTVSDFLAAPSDATLAAARTGWLASRAHYMLSEGARFASGPIDADGGNPEAEINSWPLDEANLDYVTSNGVADDTMGLINNPSSLPSITVAAIDAANAQGGDDNITDGYHAIEFLLWGQATSDVGPGTRSFMDYVVGGGHPNVDRRSQYLSVATQGVIEHLTEVQTAWAPGATYRAQFESGSVGGQDSLALILTGLGKFSKGELAGQRIDAPYQSKSRRDQHDCFSSESLTDYTRDAQGVVDLYNGTYGSSTGPGISTLIAQFDPTTASMLSSQINASVADMQLIPPPFEQAIEGADSDPGRTAILTTVNSLRAQGDLFATAAASIGLTIVVPENND